MNDFITMTCKSCGGKLQITPETDDFACMYCGTEFKVNRGGGIVTISPIIEELKNVSINTDKTASELAIVRLNKEINKLNKELIEEQNRFNLWEREELDIINAAKSKPAGFKIIASVVIAIISFILTSVIFISYLDTLFSWCAGNMIIFIVLALVIYFFPFEPFQKERNEINQKNYLSKLEKEKEKQEIIKGIISGKEREIDRHYKIVGGAV